MSEAHDILSSLEDRLENELGVKLVVRLPDQRGQKVPITFEYKDDRHEETYLWESGEDAKNFMVRVLEGPILKHFHHPDNQRSNDKEFRKKYREIIQEYIDDIRKRLINEKMD